MSLYSCVQLISSQGKLYPFKNQTPSTNFCEQPIKKSVSSLLPCPVCALPKSEKLCSNCQPTAVLYCSMYTMPEHRQFTYFPIPIFHLEKYHNTILQKYSCKNETKVSATSLMKKCFKRPKSLDLSREARDFKLQDSREIFSLITRIIVM